MQGSPAGWSFRLVIQACHSGLSFRLVIQANCPSAWLFRLVMHAGHSGRLVGLVIQAGYLGWSLRKQQAGYSVWTNKDGFKSP